MSYINEKFRQKHNEGFAIPFGMPEIEKDEKCHNCNRDKKAVVYWNFGGDKIELILCEDCAIYLAGHLVKDCLNIENGMSPASHLHILALEKLARFNADFWRAINKLL